MKKLLLVAGILGMLAVAQDNKPRPRFEVLMREDVYWNSGMDTGTAEVWHDRETGQEIVCIHTMGNWDGTASCYLTGRKW